MRPTLLHERTDLGVFAVTGGDRLSWLNGLVTQDVGKLAPGAGAYGLAVGKTGRILAELWFVATDATVLVIAAKARMAGLREHFDKHLVMEDAEMGPPLERAVLMAHGEAAPALAGRVRALGGDAAAVDWTGRGDAAVLVAAEGALPTTLANALEEPGIQLVDDAAWEGRRIAWGLPRFGVDFDDQTLPQEASLERVAVSFTKGCYLGQETVFMLEKRGHARKKLVRLAVEGDGELAPGVEIVLADGASVGTITSATRAPDGGVLAIGSVKSKHVAAGTDLVAGGRAAHVLGLALSRD
jgi:folate-binding protein YgfZ